MTRSAIALAFVASLPSLVRAQATPNPVRTHYQWTREKDTAAFEGSYNFPVFVVHSEMWAFHPRGGWSSRDGRTWVRSELPASGLNTGYQHYVQFHDAVYALGTMTGNYLDLHLTSRIARTRDFKRWEVLASESNLPARVFYGAAVFQDKIWLLGGFDGHTYYNDVWSSADAVHWTRVAEHAGWTPRDADMVPVFKNRIWVIGGGVIDGQPEPNPNAKREVWSSADGINENGTQRFIYRNDVWSMSPRSR